MTGKIRNPFLTHGYIRPEFFCNREKETDKLIEAIENGRNVTLYGRRKFGKTALIQHVFHRLPKSWLPIWIDLLPTRDFESFIHTFANSILSRITENQPFVRKFYDGIKTLRPVISYDDLTGMPQVKLDLTDQRALKSGFEYLLKFLQDQKRTIVIAFDEFQQIGQYPEQNTEAYLRTILQGVPDIAFLFSGSDQHLLNDMFTRVDRPFYQMSQMMRLEAIDPEIYSEFIQQHFIRGKRQLSEEHIRHILSWTQGITYNVQFLCNRLYATGKRDITGEDIRLVKRDILQEQEDHFYVLRQMLTNKQWRVLSAIAMEEKARSIYGKEFLSKYGFYNSSSVKRAVESLENHHLIYRTQVDGTSEYQLQDLFLSKWIRNVQANG